LTVLTAKDVCRSYGMRDVLRGATLGIEDGERLGVVGRNGSGKTTLARIIAGDEAPDSGEVVRANGLRIGVLRQEPRFEPGTTAIDAVLDGRPQWREAMRRHDEACTALERGEGDLDALVTEQSEAAAMVEDLGGWDRRHVAEAVLGHVGMLDGDALVDTMSGGERRRVALARLLVAEPDLAIMDEPTNHLDIAAIEWLERWLVERFRGALLLITHDRYLLDNVVTRTLEVEDGRVHSYAGGWGAYLEAKAERMAHAERTESNRQNYLRRELEWLRRSPKARTTKSKARIDRITAVADTGPAATARDATIAVGHVRSGSTILEAVDLGVMIGDRTLVEGLTLRLTKGERIGIVGPNGCGKTTLLRVLTQQQPPSAGKIVFGKNTKLAILDQLRTGLPDDAKVYDAVAEGGSRITVGGQEIDVRTYLERFLFTSAEQQKKVGVLSGGERARVALAKTLQQDANVLVLDEPTNDLDVSTLAALEDALLEFAGTALVVTHDRWFLDRFATSILAFEGTRVVQYAGGFSDWAARRDAAAKAAPPPPPPVAPAPTAKTTRRTGLTYAETIELEGLLEKVDEAETRAAGLEAETAAADFYTRPEPEQRAHFEAVAVARAEANALAERWTELEARRDA
jgi:ATP-binding cassette subfamily F protein uup